MSKFKVGDNIICPKDREGEESSKGIVFAGSMSRYVGKVMKITSILGNGGLRANAWVWDPEWVELAEDRTNWHPHHDVIVAWAKDWKGLTIQHKHQGSWFDCGNPQWREDKEYRVKPEPDHTAEIADIERKMRELADRLEKLK